MRPSRSFRLFGFLLLLGGYLLGCGDGSDPSQPELTPPATQLAFANQPPDQTAGEPFSVSVEVRDALGTVVAGATNAVTLALGSNPSGGTLSGTLTVNAVNGVASISGLSINDAEDGYALTASSSGLTGVTSAAFEVMPAAPWEVVFTEQPGDAEGNQAIAPAIDVAVRDSLENVVTTSTAAVTLEIAANPGGATLSGTLTVNAVGGTATFNDVGLDAPSAGYTLTATSGTLIPGTSASFDVGLSFNTLALGDSWTCGVTVSNSAYCWGFNGQGQLGDGAQATRRTPTLVTGGHEFVQVDGGNGHTCGVTTSGAAYCWGDNSFGELGDGSTTGSLTPLAVSGGITFSSVSANTAHSCGVATNGDGYCWGGNSSGTLGDGTMNDATTPVMVAGSLGFASLVAGNSHSCGVTTSGAAYCWGDNGSGRLGDGTTTDRLTPVAVAGGLSFDVVDPGRADHSCGLTTGGDAYCWGSNFEGELGDGTMNNSSVPVMVTGGLSFASLSAGGAYACGTTDADEGYCWGFNTFGQLGDGTMNNSPTPIQTSGGLSFTSIVAGSSHTCGFADSGEVYCWGFNGSGQLGDGTTDASTTPVRVVQ